MSFFPALASHQAVSLPATGSQTLHFTFCAPDSHHDASVPEVWTNLPKGQWQAVAFRKHTIDSQLWIATIDVTCDNAGLFEFTFRMNHGNDKVQWLGSSGSNGTVELVHSSRIDSPMMGCPFSFEDGANINAETDGAILATFGLSNGRSGDVQSFKLKHNAKNLLHANGLVLERTERTWITPRQLYGRDCVAGLSPEYDGSLLYIRAPPSNDEPTPQSVLIFPVSTTAVCSSLRGGDSSVWLRCTRDSPSNDVTGHVVVAWGSDQQFSTLLQRCISLARNVIKTQDPFWQQLETRYPPLEPQGLQGLTVCTWNALNYDHYKESDVEQWLEGLTDETKTSALFSRAIETVLLDDGWQDVEVFLDTVDGSKNRRAVRSFEARKEWLGHQTGRGLKAAVDRIKAKGVKRVGVWMTLEGYWDGLSPNGPIAKAYDLGLWQVDTKLPKFAEGDTHWYFPKLDDVSRYYHDYFSELKRAGVDFVKVDDQAHQDYLVEPSDSDKQTDSGLIRQEMLKRMRQASNEVFGTGTTINCMAHSPRIWNGALGLIRTGHRSLMRNSDDYFPDRPDSHPWHLFVNAYNTWLTSALELVPDFDMCQERTTKTHEPHPFGTYHISFRAFSPAPTFSTDVPVGPFTDPKGWYALLAKTKNEQVPTALPKHANSKAHVTKLVKTTSASGKALENRLGEDVLGSGQGQPLRVGLSLEHAQGGHIGLWNVRRDGGRAKGCIDSLDVHDVLKDLGGASGYNVILALDGRVVVVGSESLKSATSRLHAQPLEYVDLGEREFKIATIARMHTLSVATASGNRVAVETACLGLMDKHTGLAVVTSASTATVALATKAVAACEPPSPRVPSSPPPSYSSLARQPGVSSATSPLLSFPQPHPQSRLAFILYYLVNPTLSLSTSSDQRQPRPLSTLTADMLRRPVSTLWFETRTLIGFTLAVIMWGWSKIGSSLKNKLEAGRRNRSIESGPSTPFLDSKSLSKDTTLPATIQTEAGDDKVTTREAFQVCLSAVSKEFGVWFKSTGGDLTVVELVERLQVTLDGHVVPGEHITIVRQQGERIGIKEFVVLANDDQEVMLAINVESVADHVGYDRGDGNAFWTCEVSFS
ncbi:hypothetical protein OIV83_005777 [Microbotryomycetes sp. JL201]|nr:hypothetical protein OIV83_005777 [Microbotryomycetes sp. JL201]